jgi:putative membrane protein
MAEKINDNEIHDPSEKWPLPILAVRGGIAGVLMGLANLVPGVSGGTMLLAAGVYQRFIASIADVTTLNLKPRSIVTLASVVGAAVLGIVLLAGPVKDLVVHQRWIMYSLFIGLTLGGVPLVWNLVKPASLGTIVWAILAFALMGLMALGGSGGASGSDDRNVVMLGIAGMAAASAMILPGVSGGYLLLLLGQYVPILASVSRLKDAVSGRDLDAVMAEMGVVIPVGVGVVVGVVVVANALKWLLARFEKATLGALLGLLFGAVVGLWPFQEGVPPAAGDVIKGVEVTEATIESVEPEDWPVAFFTPTPGQVVGSIVLILAGFGGTVGLARFGSGKKEAARAEAVDQA